MASGTETGAARRLSPEARRRQLIESAIWVLARRGWIGLDLDEVAERAGVSRNLIYHYFPEGRIDLMRAATEQAGEALVQQWSTDSELPLERRMEANFERVIAHALEPSDLWLAYRQGNLAGDPEIERLQQQFRSEIVAGIARNHFGTEAPPPLAALALRAYVDFAERALDECRERGLDPGTVEQLLTETMLEVVASARRLSEQGSVS